MPKNLQKTVTLYPRVEEELNSPINERPIPNALDPPIPNRVICSADDPAGELVHSTWLCSDLETFGVLLKDCPCDVSVFIGAALRMSSGVCVNAIADTFANSRVVGIAVFKKSTTLCDVVVSGKTNDIFVGLDDSKDYFLSPSSAGDITATVPVGAGEIIQPIGRPFSATLMYVDIKLSMQRAP